MPAVDDAKVLEEGAFAKPLLLELALPAEALKEGEGDDAGAGFGFGAGLGSLDLNPKISLRKDIFPNTNFQAKNHTKANVANSKTALREICNTMDNTE